MAMECSQWVRVYFRIVVILEADLYFSLFTDINALRGVRFVVSDYNAVTILCLFGTLPQLPRNLLTATLSAASKLSIAYLLIPAICILSSTSIKQS